MINLFLYGNIWQAGSDTHHYIDYGHLKTLIPLSKYYRVTFYDQRGAGLSPRVDKKYLTLEQSLKDPHSIVEHFSNGGKVKLIGHSWGAMVTVGYLAKHPERVSHAVIFEPGFLSRDALKDWVEQFTESISIWEIVHYFIAYPYRFAMGYAAYWGAVILISVLLNDLF